jgi:hypothetical protein
VPLDKIFHHVFGDDALMLFQRVQVTVAFLGRDLEADVQQLAEARIKRRIFLVVPKRIGELLGTLPAASSRPTMDIRLGKYAVLHEIRFRTKL